MDQGNSINKSGAVKPGMPFIYRMLWLLLSLCVLVYMLPIILICGLLGMSITARNRMNAAFALRDSIVNKQIEKRSQ